MAKFIYIDETGSVGKGASKQPQLILVAVIVDEEKVMPLGENMRQIAEHSLACLPGNLEFHGNEIWGGKSCWSNLDPPALIAVYEAAINLLPSLGLSVAHSTINKSGLHERYSGAADGNAYLLALQFLLEKVDSLGAANKIVVADEAKEYQFKAIKMIRDMQQWGLGEVPGKQLRSVIDSLHFVESHASPGVQMADLVAFIIQRYRLRRDSHPNAVAAVGRLVEIVNSHTSTYRQPWP